MWDRYYMEYENTYHQAVLRIATTAAGVTQNASEPVRRKSAAGRSRCSMSATRR